MGACATDAHCIYYLEALVVLFTFYCVLVVVVVISMRYLETMPALATMSHGICVLFLCAYLASKEASDCHQTVANNRGSDERTE